jgi:hypothetical protein
MMGWSDALQDAEREMWNEIAVNDGGATVTSTYGAVETNGMDDHVKALRDAVHNGSGEIVDLGDKRLGRITRLRLVTDRDVPFWDLSYCYGTLKNGEAVRVRFPQSQFPKQGLNQSLVEMCRSVGAFGKGLGIFDPEVISKLYG